MKLKISEKIRHLRTGRGLTQEQLAEAMGMTKKSVSFIENGKDRKSVV